MPELAGSWLLTALIQLPSICFLLFNNNLLISNIERAFHIIEFIFIVMESIMGYFAIKLMVDIQALKFQVSDSFAQVWFLIYDVIHFVIDLR